jgi:hypothetical protein
MRIMRVSFFLNITYSVVYYDEQLWDLLISRLQKVDPVPADRNYLVGSERER